MKSPRYQQLNTLIGSVPMTRFFVLHCSTVMGFVDLRHADVEQAQLSRLFVHEAYRRKGVATHFMADCIARAVESKCNSIALFVETTNSAAIQFYHKSGFAGIDAQDGELLMARPIGLPSPNSQNSVNSVKTSPLPLFRP